MARIAFVLTLSLIISLCSADLPTSARMFDISKLPLAVDCTHIRIPAKLCTTCRMRPFDSKGRFVNRRDIYDLSSKECRAGLRRYVKLNPCDTIRAAQIADLTAPGAFVDLARFMYSICETCCDCVPIGAEPGEWELRNELGPQALMKVTRGNCVVHTLFDMCKMWPLVKSVVRPKENFKETWPEICPLLRTWFRSPASDMWQRNPRVMVSFDIRRFILKFVNVMKCRKEIVWEECAALEFAQGAI